ncbi:MAG TPA: hypothetical protein PLD02_13995, partial [Saprospiraceae bacterium]|nr:hypothetical protein [Saprospiraceae bacterium]
MSENNTFSKITTEIGFALQPLGRALSSVDLFTSFLRQLGWSVDQIPQPIQDLGNAVSSLISNLELVIEENA